MGEHGALIEGDREGDIECGIIYSVGFETIPGEALIDKVQARP